MKLFAFVFMFALGLMMLTGCSSFKLGGVVYCPVGADCKFEMKR